MNRTLPSDAPRAYQPLSAADLRRRASSVFAENAQPGVSARYTFVSTASVVDLLRDEGWEPVLARQQRVRLPERSGFQMHEIRFARRDDLKRGMFEVGDVRPEMILQNAHDGRAAYRIDAGLFRLVCRNGLVVADAQFASVAIRHVDVSADVFAAAARATAESTPKILDAVARWQHIVLSDSTRREFAAHALALRWNPEDPATRLLDPRQLLAPLRYADCQRNLWTTFNVVQERLLRGGLQYSGKVPETPNAAFPTRLVRNTIRPLTGLVPAQRLNKELWQLAERFAQS